MTDSKRHLQRLARCRDAIGPRLRSRLAAVHRDERGSMSLVSLFGLMFLVVLLGMVMNSGQQFDQKVKMQGAADAATYSGSVLFARNMNTLVFTNHLISDIFALTAVMREAEAQQSRPLAHKILDRWQQMGPIFVGSPFPRFDRMGQGIVEKVPRERVLIDVYSDWMASMSAQMLPALEFSLDNELIPEFQRALVATAPELIQSAADEVARLHGDRWPRDTEVRGVLWHADGYPIGVQSQDERRTLPVVDPLLDNLPDQQDYFDRAVAKRRELAFWYLALWNQNLIGPEDGTGRHPNAWMDNYGRMSKFGPLWRTFTCGELLKLLEEDYPDTNLPMLLAIRGSQVDDPNQHLDYYYSFVGTCYRAQVGDRIPGVFDNPIPTDTVTYAQAMVFVPRRRIVWGHWWNSDLQQWIWDPVRQGGSLYSENWDLFNQNWTAQLVPATAAEIPTILSTSPGVHGINVQTPDLTGLNREDLHFLSHH